MYRIVLVLLAGAIVNIFVHIQRKSCLESFIVKVCIYLDVERNNVDLLCVCVELE